MGLTCISKRNRNIHFLHSSVQCDVLSYHFNPSKMKNEMYVPISGNLTYCQIYSLFTQNHEQEYEMQINSASEIYLLRES